MYGGLQIRSVRTDNGGEFDGHFHEHMVVSKIRHERSLPNRPQTNARAERFHRTFAEGMRSLMLMSGVPYVFWPFCVAAFVFLYARTAPASGQSSPLELRFSRPYKVESLHPFGSACYFFEEQQLDKFEPRGRLGVVLGYGRLHSYVLLLNITRIAKGKFALSTLVMFGFSGHQPQQRKTQKNPMKHAHDNDLEHNQV